MTLADRGLCTHHQADLHHKEGTIQGAIMALRLLRRFGITQANVDRLERNFLHQLDEVQHDNLVDIGLDA